MIEKLILYNFQQHRRLSLEFASTITTLVGVSRKGKSSVLRSLRFIAQNGPSGGYTKHGEGSFKITLYFDSHRLVRKKGKENSYTLDQNEPYRAIKTNVPEEIANLLNVSDINFQSQLDSPFWFSLTPGEAARELNKIVNLELIDSTLSKLSSGLKRISLEEEILKKRVEASEQRIKDLAWVPLAERDWKHIEEKEADIALKHSRIARMALLLEEGKSVTSSLEDVSEMLMESNKIRNSLEAHAILLQRAESLRKLIQESRRVEEERNSITLELADAQRDLKQILGNNCPLCGRS